MKNKVLFPVKILLCLLLAISTAIFADDPAPLVVMKNASNQIVAELNKHLGKLENNKPLIDGIVRNLLVPHVDVDGMSKNVVGRLYWDAASADLQKQFVTQFTNYVIRTYSTALSSYEGEIITFYPIRGYTKDQTRVQIESAINHKDKPANHVQYRLVANNNTWLVYDFSVDGVSFIQNYRSQFSDTLQQGGLSLLVQKLVEQNKAYNN